jgi:hypothetical protein
MPPLVFAHTMRLRGARLSLITTTTADSQPQVTASIASAIRARLPILSAMAILRRAR